MLSDILGDEDALGDMDFKITGTRDGIVGCQMDIKVDGLSYELLEKALLQARDGRLHILDKMNQVLPEAREDLKPHAPRILEIIIEKSQIGAVIGPGGKVIQEIQASTGTIINIEEVGDKGIVNIASANKDSLEAARQRIVGITYVPKVGDVFDAVVRTIMPYGVFVDFMGKSGLLHVSEISYSRIDNVEDVFKEGDMVKVQLVEVEERTGKMRMSRKSLLPKPERKKNENGEYEDGYGEEGPPAREERSSFGDRDRGDRGGDRRGGGGDRRGGGGDAGRGDVAPSSSSDRGHYELAERRISDHASQHPPRQLGRTVDRLKDHLGRCTNDRFKLVNLMHRAQLAEQCSPVLGRALRQQIAEGGQVRVTHAPRPSADRAGSAQRRARRHGSQSCALRVQACAAGHCRPAWR